MLGLGHEIEHECSSSSQLFLTIVFKSNPFDDFSRFFDIQEQSSISSRDAIASTDGLLMSMSYQLEALHC